MLQQLLTIVEDKGSGQPLVILFEREKGTELPFYLLDNPVDDSRIILVSLPEIDELGCNALTENLLTFLDQQSIRQASLIGFGEAGAVVQNFAIAHQKRVRRILLVDSPTRPHVRWIEKVLNKIEKALPLGLPFRATGAAFDARAFLQRIRCPSMVVITEAASEHVKAEAKILSDSMATAWFKKLTLHKEKEEFVSIIKEFYSVPAKRPQKNRAA